MYTVKRLAIYLAMIVLLCSIFLGCSKVASRSQDSLSTGISLDSIDQNQKDQEEEVADSHASGNESLPNPSKLESWVGEYSFSESSPPDQNIEYFISINQDNNQYYAQINIDGFQTMQRLKARVLGDENYIQLIFEKYLPDNLFELYDKGDLLLRLKRENEEIYTFWEKMNPMLDSNRQSGQICFLSNTDNNLGNNSDNNSDNSNHEDLLTEYMQGELIGIWHASPSVGAGYSERFFFYEDGTFRFCYSQYDEEKRILDMAGSWTVKGKQLILSITQETVLVGGELAEPSPSSTSKYSIVNATKEKRVYDSPKTIEYTLGKLEEDKEDTDGLIYRIKLLINGQYYWRISLDPYSENYSE